MAEASESKSPSLAWIGAYLVGVPYLFGYLVVTIHLARFSVAPLDLIRVQYIAAGVWSVLPLIFLLFPFVFFAFSLDADRKKSEPGDRPLWRRLLTLGAQIVSALLGALGASVAVIAVLNWASGGLMGGAGVDDIIMIIKFLGGTCLFALLLVACGFTAWRSFADVDYTKPLSSFGDLIGGSCFALIEFVLMISYLFYFASNMYGKIAAYLGGGASIPVVIGFKDSDDHPDKAKTIVSGPYELLATTERNLYVLRPNTKKAIEISRDSVETIEFGEGGRPQ